MKEFLAYVFYISITSFITGAFQSISTLSIGWSRFIAADGPPGDISTLTKYLFSFGMPLPIIESTPLSEMNDLEERFEVLPCRTTPPIAAGGQIQKPYVYKVRGDGKQLQQLVNYIHNHVKEHKRVELWSIWHSDQVSSNNLYRFKTHSK